MLQRLPFEESKNYEGKEGSSHENTVIWSKNLPQKLKLYGNPRYKLYFRNYREQKTFLIFHCIVLRPPFVGFFFSTNIIEHNDTSLKPDGIRTISTKAETRARKYLWSFQKSFTTFTFNGNYQESSKFAIVAQAYNYPYLTYL